MPNVIRIVSCQLARMVQSATRHWAILRHSCQNWVGKNGLKKHAIRMATAMDLWKLSKESHHWSA